ncbi:threonylcarbamoyl-AMP synthase [Limisphaera ngatamarikiensis]|uniref:Threonylcarbamoyl-AMP synthase n=1 Tax=Limisphaera ngatamarikiensis TaxID=1324935 RepID=A0A6M1RSN6_9BACT|nr:L-threonylcarbamoyladenylate synthase [Limisphaera ngatamarikiensis]NGO37802.1 threonylcarbamoyl-AMP synthase [Limisphaera ngatamarikiensis]
MTDPDQTLILSADTPERLEEAVRAAAELLRAGNVVALPTETVYGLAANALNPAAVRKIYEIKGRPPSNPLIVHVASLEMARRCAGAWPPAAEALARAFWPGPLTLVLPKTDIIPPEVTAGRPTVALRWPDHALIQAVIRTCGFPLAAPSANLANRVSPTEAGHVAAQLGGRIPLIVDGGPCTVGIESTVLDLTVSPPCILRPGMIHADALAAVLNTPVTRLRSAPDPHAPQASPGLFPKHYAPAAPLLVLRWHNTDDLCRKLRTRGFDPARAHVLAHSRVPDPARVAEVRLLPHEPGAYARALYAAWHRCDQSGAQLIVMEAVPDDPAWAGIADRLQRAQGENAGPA